MTTRRKTPKKPESFAAGVGRGMRRAAKTARKVARMHGTPVYFWENGKVVAKKPQEPFASNHFALITINSTPGGGSAACRCRMGPFCTL
jgi:hypothetical protein